MTGLQSVRETFVDENITVALIDIVEAVALLTKKMIIFRVVFDQSSREPCDVSRALI